MGIREMREESCMRCNWTEKRSRPHILPIRQTGSPQKAALLTRRLMGKLITPALYSSEGSTSPSLRSSLSLFHQAAAVKCYL